LGQQVHHGAVCEGNVGQAVVESEEELGGFAILELGKHLDRHGLSVGEHIGSVEGATSVLSLIENVSDVPRRDLAAAVASGCSVCGIVLESKAKTDVHLTSGSSEFQEVVSYGIRD
jgi:hypothetical protein